MSTPRADVPALPIPKLCALTCDKCKKRAPLAPAGVAAVPIPDLARYDMHFLTRETELEPWSRYSVETRGAVSSASYMTVRCGACARLVGVRLSRPKPSWGRPKPRATGT